MTFDLVIAVDWSARSAPSPRTPTKDAIFICCGTPQGAEHPTYHRTRADADAYVRARLDAALAVGQRVFLGYDFAFGYPMGFARALTGQDGALAVWDWLEGRITDAADNANNRFEVAAAINRAMPGLGPFWGRPAHLDLPDLPAKGNARSYRGPAERRAVEAQVTSAQPVWKLFTTGSVGSQTLVGLPYLARLRRTYGTAMQVWPMQCGWQQPDAAITLAEIYPSMMTRVYPTPLATQYPDGMYHLTDARQVRWVVDSVLAQQGRDGWTRMFHGTGDPAEEGWIFGATPPERVP